MNPIRTRLGPPSVFLMVIAIIQVCFHVAGLGFAVLMVLSDPGKGNDSRTAACVIFVLGVLFGCKDVVVLRGVAAMRDGRNRGRALLGASVALFPDAGWIFALPAAIWCLITLNDRDVSRAFAGYYDDDDDDDF
jgi:hypothetical protein